ncbi:ribbon-helix-helix protein, CopG family [Pseudonocardia sp. CA-142604]|uniref:ribbon-helix-helix protein, CopG family n=1 Tax=Pseudonocardia sp. CA-142604 TaxID=3240024 RepID=UPI003D944FC3
MAMTLRLTEDESEALRMQAEIEHRSMQDVAREAVREYIARHAHLSRVHGALEVLTPRYEELLDRLGKA